MSNKKEKKTTRKVINNFGIGEDELKNSIIQYENAPPDIKLPIQKEGSLILENIIYKIKNVVNEINEERLKKANISSLGTTLKSLVQAYHFLELHFSTPQEIPTEIEFKNEEEILEKTSEIIFKVKKKWDKGK